MHSVAARAATNESADPRAVELGARRTLRGSLPCYLRQSDVFMASTAAVRVDRARPADFGRGDTSHAGGMPKLVYVQSPAPDRDPRLSDMLHPDPWTGLSYRGSAPARKSAR